MNYFISDLHLGHKNVLKFDNRPFINIEEHDKTIIDNWNNKVNDNDDWVHLYGHVHNSFEENMIQHFRYEMGALYDKPCHMYNVGAMMKYMDYTPRTLEEIIRREQNK